MLVTTGSLRPSYHTQALADDTTEAIPDLPEVVLGHGAGSVPHENHFLYAPRDYSPPQRLQRCLSIILLPPSCDQRRDVGRWRTP
jgi:hypothetical protein